MKKVCTLISWATLVIAPMILFSADATTTTEVVTETTEVTNTMQDMVIKYFPVLLVYVFGALSGTYKINSADKGWTVVWKTALNWLGASFSKNAGK